MQTLSPSLQAAVIDIDARVTPRNLVDLYELYSTDAVPGVDGFDPADAIETFAAEEITWNGIAYRRELISRGDITRNFGEKTNTVTLTFSNISRYLATLAQTQQIEGLMLVIRCVVPSVTDDSIVLFVGRCDKPSDIDKKTFSLTARQDFGNINQEIPPRVFAAEDPNGRVPSDPLYEGFRILPLSGLTPPEKVKVPSTSFFGRLFGKTKTELRTQQWSSLDDTPYGSVVPMVLGRCQMEAIPIFFADIGFFLIIVAVLSEGRIDSISNTTLQDKRFTIQTERDAFGDLGGTGTNNYDVNPSDYPEGAIHHGYLSRTAYIVLSMKGSTLEDVDDPPVITSLVRGVQVPLPDSSGDYTDQGWSDNPVHIARFILTDPRLVNIDSAFMEDAVNYLTGIHCDEPLIDDSNSEVSLIPAADIPQTGLTIRRYPSTGVITPRLVRYYKLGLDPDIIPEEQENTYTSYANDDIPAVFEINRVLRKRYTFNAPITDKVRAVDFLYKVVFPTFKGFLRINKKGKYEIRSEQSSDATMLTSDLAVGATATPVLDVTPWKSGPDLLTGRILLGFGLTTSEVRDISSAVYSTVGNSVTLAVSVTGGITLTRSGATLSGGSTSVQASGTVTVGGTPANGDTATVTIDGIASVHTLNADDNTGTVGALLTALINANPQLKRYIVAEWDSASPTLITIKAKYGALNLISPLLKTHAGPIADPSSSPSLSSSTGSLAAGVYKVAYADVNALGQTALSPVSSISLAASKQIDVGALALPTGITSRNWYMSDAPGSPYLKYVGNTNGSSFSINGLPSAGAPIPKGYNTTGEELIRIAMSFATNSQDIYPVWPASRGVLLTETYLPTVPNGHKYIVTTAGITGSAEPTWPTTAGATVTSGTAVFTESGSTVLQQAGLTRANIKKDTYKWPLGSRQASVNQIKGKYRDANNDFALTPFTVNDRTHQSQVHKIYPYEIDLSGVDNSHQKDRIGNFLLAKFREGDWFNALETGPQGMVLEEGDVICSSDDSGGLVNQVTRIEELRIQPNHDVTIAQARKYSTLMFADEVGQDIIPVPTTLRYSQTVDSIIEFIDNFPIRDADGLIPGFYIAVSRDLADTGDWRGWALYADYGDGYVKKTENDLPALIGVCDTTLASVSDPSIFDRANSLDFTLKYGPPPPFPAPFTSCTEAELLANSRKNLFVVGDEYVQAATIVDNGDFSYTISKLLRGRFGTDGHQLTHGATERIVYLDGSEQFVSIDPVRLNTEYDYKGVTTNQNVSDASPVPFTWAGGTIRPLSPINLRGYRDADGNLVIQWTRRSRVAPGLRPLSDIPLAEENEEYEIEIYDGGDVVRTWRVRTSQARGVVWDDLTVNLSTVSLAAGVGGSLDYIDASFGGNGVASAVSSQTIWQDCRLDFVLPTGANAPYAVGLAPLSEVGTMIPASAAYWSAQNNFPETQAGLSGGAPAAGDKFSIELQGGVFRYYREYTGPSTLPVYISTVHQLGWPYVAFAYFNTPANGFTDQGLETATLFRGIIDTVYTADQQTADGFTPSVTPITVRVYQVSQVVGRGDFREAVL